MAEMIAYCGLDCNKCNVLIATQKNDYEEKKKIAERWTKTLHVDFTPEDITCDGCKSERISGWCSKICKVRPCAEERKVETCAHCDDYACEKLKEFTSTEPEAKQKLEEIRKTL